MKRLDPYESLGYHCNLTLKSFVGALSNSLKGTDMSPVQFIALAHLIANGPMSQADLAARLSITRATTTRLIDRMERDKWIERITSSNDARVKIIYPTDKAKENWDMHSQAGRAVIKKAYQGIPKEDIEMVMRILERIRNNLEK
jgi:MarR family transcriptional regulator for hemolysin